MEGGDSQLTWPNPASTSNPASTRNSNLTSTRTPNPNPNPNREATRSHHKVASLMDQRQEGQILHLSIT